VFGSSNLGNWLSASPREREQRETRRAWEETQELWRASPLGQTTIFDLTIGLIEELQQDAPRVPALPVLIALAEATDRLLGLEDIHETDAIWPAIDGDMAVAISFREMTARRRRWATDFETCHSIFKRQVNGTYLRLFEMLPDTCFSEWSEQSTYEVPLVELLERPVQFIEQLILMPYEDDTFSNELFRTLRHRLATNMVVASGFPPSTNPMEVQDKLLMPHRQKGKSARELADLYLAGTPFASLLELPIPFDVPSEARFEHCHIIGGTGHGKTQLLQRMIHADLVAAKEDGRSVVVIDSQGDLINKIVRLDLFAPDDPDSLAQRLVLIDPADVEYPASLNLFDAHLERMADYRPVDRERVLNGVVELYETFFGDLLGAELTQKQGVIFKYLARLMLSMEGATIHTLMQLMEDGRGFKPYMALLDGSARYFFETEFFDGSFSATKKQILKRLWGILSTPAFERMFAQTDNKLDLFEATQAGKIVLISTAKDLLKRDGSALFGRFFIAMLAQAALERSTLDADERTATFVYVDEAQEYFDDSVETILTQARKYRVSFTAAHQTLDQLSPRLRSAFLANTSFKCAGGVSAKDANAIAGELHTSADFIEGMRRRGDRTEFAAWLKHRTPEAIRLSVPLGHLERQPSLTEEQLDALLDLNRARYCGTLGDVRSFAFKPVAEATTAATSVAAPVLRDAHDGSAAPEPPRERRPHPAYEPGKGGPKHRYLQNLVKELAEQQGFRATIEAPIRHNAGQVDVLLERNGEQVAVEVSVSTPVEWERENLRKCLAAGYPRVAVVLAKSRTTQSRYRDALREGLDAEALSRLTLLSPEEVPDFIAALAPAPGPTESVVRGYKVKVSHAQLSPAEAKARRETLARLVSRSLQRGTDV
jgi:hypothetical protein